MPENRSLRDFSADVAPTGRAAGPFTPICALFIHLGLELVAASLQGQLRRSSSCAVFLAGLPIYIPGVGATPG